MTTLKSTILVTGAAGFIGSHLTDKLLSKGFVVIGIDDFNTYYNPKLKERNLENANKDKNFHLHMADILNFDAIAKLFKTYKPDVIVHLAARAGVRPSILDPLLYAEVNKIGTLNLLKLAIDYRCEKFIFGSSSSVYGTTEIIPFNEDDPCNNIISPYGSSKRSAEILVETFSKLYGLKSVILRFFTVYGPRGRPDMAPALFTRSIILGKPIVQYGNGLTYRDYTYIDDIIRGIEKSIQVDVNSRIVNLGNNNPISLAQLIETIEKISGKKAKIKKVQLPLGDVEKTWADISLAKKLLDWRPEVSFADGMKKYIGWLTKVN